jgi:hypothetical protein
VQPPQQRKAAAPDKHGLRQSSSSSAAAGGRQRLQEAAVLQASGTRSGVALAEPGLNSTVLLQRRIQVSLVEVACCQPPPA